MKKLWISALTALLVICSPGMSVTTNYMYDWYEDHDGYEEIYSIAHEEKATLIVYFHVDWCGYCEYLNEEILDDSDVDDFISNYMRVKINPEEGEEERELKDEYSVRGYPSFFVTNPHNGKKKKVHPFRNKRVISNETFIEEIQKAIEETGA